MGVFDAIASALGLGYQVYKDTSLTPAEREANAFNAQQAELNRNFEAQQAEIARDWQEQQYVQHNSPAAMMRQYREAGINPALMFGGTMPSASTSTGIPSGSSASSVVPSGAGNMVAMLAQLGDVISSIQLRKHQSELYDSEIYKNINITDAQKDYLHKLSNKTVQEISNLIRDNDRIASQTLDFLSSANLKDSQALYYAEQKNIALAKLEPELRQIEANISEIKAKFDNLNSETGLNDLRKTLTSAQTLSVLSQADYYNALKGKVSSEQAYQDYYNTYLLPIDKALKDSGVSETNASALLKTIQHDMYKNRKAWMDVVYGKRYVDGVGSILY